MRAARAKAPVQSARPAGPGQATTPSAYKARPPAPGGCAPPAPRTLPAVWSATATELRRSTLAWTAATACCRMSKPMRMPYLGGRAQGEWVLAGWRGAGGALTSVRAGAPPTLWPAGCGAPPGWAAACAPTICLWLHGSQQPSQASAPEELVVDERIAVGKHGQHARPHPALPHRVQLRQGQRQSRGRVQGRRVGG